MADQPGELHRLYPPVPAVPGSDQVHGTPQTPERVDRTAELEARISELQDAAEQNGMPPAVIQDPSEILQGARRPLSPGQERAALLERQSDLVGQLDGIQNQLADMAGQAAAQGIVLLPPTPRWGGNLTTNRIQSLDERAGQLQSALGENEVAARQAGIAASALP